MTNDPCSPTTLGLSWGIAPATQRGDHLMPSTTTARRSLADRYTAAFPLSRKLHDEARGVFPDGVTHDLRRMEPFPVYVDRALGGHKWTVDGQELIDYWSGHG